MTFSEFRTALLDDLNLTTSDTVYTTTYLNRVINRGVKWAAGLYPWPHTERAVKRDLESGQEWYDMPENFKMDEIKLVRANGETHKKLRFREYELYKEDYDNNATDKVCANYRNRLFINPIPTSDVVGGLKVWGHEVPDTLASDSDTTPFNGDTAIEEAIFLWCQGEVMKKAKGSSYDRGLALKQEAKVELDRIWRIVLKRQADYKTKEASVFDVPNLFQHNGHTKTGSFENCN